MHANHDNMNVLVFCSAGTKMNCLPWLADAPTDSRFKFAIVYYKEDDAPPPLGIHYFMRNRDYKIPNFLALVREFPEVLENDLFVFIDDDIILSQPDLIRWCEIVQRSSIDISQPSLTHDSKVDWPHVFNRAKLSVDTGQFVEIQCFALSQRALRASFPYFFMVRTGTGLDLALYSLAQRSNWRTAVIHEVSIIHPKRPEDQTIRSDFEAFSKFNQQLSHNLSFCFASPGGYLSPLSKASNYLGDTRYFIVRAIAAGEFLLSKLRARIRRARLSRTS